MILGTLDVLKAYVEAQVAPGGHLEGVHLVVEGLDTEVPPTEWPCIKIGELTDPRWTANGGKVEFSWTFILGIYVTNMATKSEAERAVDQFLWREVAGVRKGLIPWLAGQRGFTHEGIGYVLKPGRLETQRRRVQQNYGAGAWQELRLETWRNL